MQRGLAPILIVILVAVLGIGGYFVYTSLRGGMYQTVRPDVAISPASTPQPSPSTTESTKSAETANWKTYTSKYGYSFQYPSGWNIVTSNLESDDEVIINFKDPKYVPTELQIQLKIPKELPKNMDFEIWAKNNFPASPDLPQQVKEITIADIKAKELTTKYEGVYKQLLIPFRSKVYLLNFSVLFGQMGVNEEKIYNQILSTFKFTQ